MESSKQKDRCIKKWKVRGSKDAEYDVSIDENGNYSCSCPNYTFRQVECKHIAFVKAGGAIKKVRAKCVLAKVFRPYYVSEGNKLFIPLIALPDTIMMEASIIYYMMKCGYTWNEIKKERGHVPSEWTASKVLEHIARNGIAEYPADYYTKHKKIS